MIRMALAVLLLAAGTTHAAQDLEAFSLDDSRVQWREVRLEGAKLFMSAEALISLGEPAAGEMPQLTEPGKGNAIVPDEDPVVMSYSTSALGRQTDVQLLLDAGSGAAIQRTSLDSGSKQRYRIYRFTDSGAWHTTWWPADGETELPPAEWTDHSEGLRPYPSPTTGEPVAESTGLIYIAAAAPLDSPGDRLEILTYARRHLHRVTMEVTESKRVEVDYRQTDGRNSSRRTTKIVPVRILIDSETLGDDAEEGEFDMLGLKGDIELLLDPETRLPVSLSGVAKIVGQIEFRATRAVLR